MSAPVVRLATTADAAAMARIRVDAWRATYRGLVSDEVLDGFDVDDEAARFAARIGTDPRYTQLVAEQAEGGLLGYVMFGPDRDADDATVGEVYAIYVDPREQRAGVGGALLAEAVRALRADGYGTLHVWALAGNHVAADFYVQNGWQDDGVRRPLETLPDPTGRPVPEVRFSARG